MPTFQSRDLFSFVIFCSPNALLPFLLTIVTSSAQKDDLNFFFSGTDTSYKLKRNSRRENRRVIYEELSSIATFVNQPFSFAVLPSRWFPVQNLLETGRSRASLLMVLTSHRQYPTKFFFFFFLSTKQWLAKLP